MADVKRFKVCDPYGGDEEDFTTFAEAQTYAEELVKRNTEDANGQSGFPTGCEVEVYRLAKRWVVRTVKDGNERYAEQVPVFEEALFSAQEIEQAVIGIAKGDRLLPGHRSPEDIAKLVLDALTRHPVMGGQVSG